MSVTYVGCSIERRGCLQRVYRTRKQLGARCEWRTDDEDNRMCRADEPRIPAEAVGCAERLPAALAAHDASGGNATEL
jgi:hypothetical protein